MDFNEEIEKLKRQVKAHNEASDRHEIEAVVVTIKGGITVVQMEDSEEIWHVTPERFNEVFNKAKARRTK